MEASPLDPHENPAGWPEPAIPMLARALTCQFATLTRAGAPVTWPVTPFVNDDRRSVDVSTGVVYPLKAERARRNPRVSLLFSDDIGLTLKSPPVVLVKGMAAVRDSDLQANADRYVARAFRKLPAAFRGVPWPVLKRQAWYWARIWVEVTPIEISWWRRDGLDAEPMVWRAPVAVDLPESDPPPSAPGPGPWQDPPAEWRDLAAHCLGRVGNAALTTTVDGWPLAVPVREIKAAADGFFVWVHDGVPVERSGPACVTFHNHAAKFQGQTNYAFVGRCEPSGGRIHVAVERRLGHFILPGSYIKRSRHFLAYGRKLTPRLEGECRRRGQPVPEIRRPTGL